MVDGVTLTLSKVTAAPVDVSATADKGGMKSKVQVFVDAYNALAKLIAATSSTIPRARCRGRCRATARRSASRPRCALVGAASGASAVFARLSDVGIAMQRDGSLSVDANKLDAAFANPPELKRFFANTDTLVPANNGIASQFRTMGDAMLGVDGVITTRTDGLNHRIELNQDQQDSLEVRLAQTEQRLRAQYTALDTQMGQLSAISAYVTQQMAVFTNSSKA